MKPPKEKEGMGMVEVHVLPITLDTGAEITVVPEECEGKSEFMGETFTVTTFNNAKAVGKKWKSKSRLETKLSPGRQ